MPRYKIQRNNIVTAEETLALIEKMGNPMDKSMVAMLYLFGCRPCELRMLEKKDIRVHEGEGKLWVNMPTRKKPRNKTYLVTNTRWVWAFLSDPLVDVIRNHIAELNNEEKPWHYGASEKSANVMLNRKLKTHNPNVCPYLFRHSRLTKLAENGATESELTLWAGWEDSRPAKNYVHRTKLMSTNVPQTNTAEE